MPYRLFLTAEAEEDLAWIEKHDERKLKKVRKALANLQVDPSYPALRSKKLRNMAGPHRLDLHQSYVENRTPGAWRGFWVYGPEEGSITVTATIKHP
ncbi:MAG: hypothetical protein ACOCX1_04765 [Fimbriimonadaceae bacterium]